MFWQRISDTQQKMPVFAEGNFKRACHDGNFEKASWLWERAGETKSFWQRLLGQDRSDLQEDMLNDYDPRGIFRISAKKIHF